MTSAEMIPSARGGDFDVERVRKCFPALHQRVNGKPLVYLDNAATAFKPQSVIDAVVQSLSVDSANVHRGVHKLSQRATEHYEDARRKLCHFLGAASTREIVYVRGATEALNLVAYSYGGSVLTPGDEVLITGLEHHANIVPWQQICAKTGAKLVVVPVTDEGEVLVSEFRKRLSTHTKIAAFAHVSNALGTVLPVEELVRLTHEQGAVAVVDGAQAVAHLPVQVGKLDCDFYVLSGHKLYGPDGIGVLYGKAALLEQMPPFQTGGDMILSVSFEHTEFNELPYKFEAGTPAISAAIGLGAAVDFIEGVGLEVARAHEAQLLEFGTRLLKGIKGVRLIGTAPHKAGVLSFVVDSIHPHDIGTILDQEGIAVRTGHHCAQPIVERFGLSATVRASLAMFNTEDDLSRLACGIERAKELFA